MRDPSSPTRARTHTSCIRRWSLNQRTARGVSPNHFLTVLWQVFKLLKMCKYVLGLVTQSCPTLCDPRGCSPPGSSVCGDSPGKNTWVGCHALLQGNFLTEESNRGLPNCRWILYCLSHEGSPGILGRVAYLFSRGNSQPRNQTRVFCIAGGFFFSSWATWEAHRLV